ncbi:MAG: hypothetical protein IJR00_07475 [Lachnospiraceae bacterium]|nr:hypothetical protein [Lachnospiraceae bacterium]MBR0091578.1 hypothetical protein [Lachnospiraceae bacterium]
MSFDKGFTKENLDVYLKELAKEFRKLNGRSMPAEIILIGGAAVVINYGFREMTYDMDAIINAASSMKDAIGRVGDKYDLPVGWLNADFMKTSSYTPNIVQYSRYYKTFANIVTFRTVTGEYLLAMKLMAGRQYKYDLSDVIGVLWEQENKGAPISVAMVKEAAENLYGSYELLPEDSRLFIERAIEEGQYGQTYQQVRQIEAENKDILLQFQEAYPGVTNKDNVNDILAAIRRKKEGT